MAVSFFPINPVYIAGKGGDVQNAQYTIGDAVLESTTSKTSRLSAYPTQVGVDSVDAIVKEPITYTLKSVVGTSPVGGIDENLSGVAVTSALQLGGPLLSSAASVSTAFLSNGDSRGKETWAELSTYWEQSTRFDIQTGLELIRNVSIVSLSNEQDYSNSTGLSFDIEMRQIPVSDTTQATKADVSTLPVTDSASTMGQSISEMGEKALQSAEDIFNSASSLF